MTGRPVSPVFVGRSDELSRLVAAHARAVARRPAAVIVSGEAGIGKSRLVSELFAAIETEGTRSVIGRCAPVSEASLPYAPFVEALHALAPQRGRSGVLKLLAPAIAMAGGPGGGEIDSSGRIAAFAAILDLLERQVRRKPLAVVIEDLHWAGPSTVDLLLHVVRNAPPGLLLIVTVRRPGSQTPSHFDRFLPEIAEQDGGELLELGPLEARDVARLTEEIVEGPLRPELLAGIRERSGGNPLFIEELCGAALHGRVDDLSAQLRELILSRTSELGPDARRVLELASAIGDEADLATVSAAAALPRPDSAAAVEELAARGIATSGGEAPTSMRFRHSLVREVVYADLPEHRRAELHGLVADVLASDAGSRRPPGRSGLLAYHWQRAEQPARAVQPLLAAAEEAVRAFALDEASAHLARCLAIWESLPAGERPSDEALWRVYLRAGEVAATQGDPVEAERMLSRAEELVSGAHEVFLLRERRAVWSWQAGDERRAYEIWSKLADGPPLDPGAGAEALHSLARALMYIARFEEAAPIARDAAERARRDRLVELEIEATITLGMALTQSDRVEEGIEALRRAAFSAISIRSFRHLRLAYSLLCVMLIESERYDEAIRVGREYLATTERLEVPAALRFRGIENYVAVLQIVGQWDEAARLLDDALTSALPDRSMAGLLMLRAALRCGRGDLDGATRDLDEVRTRAPRIAQHSFVGTIRAVRAEIAVWREEPDAARREIRAGLEGADDVVQAQEDMFHELVLLGMRVEADQGLRQRTSRLTAVRGDPVTEAARLMTSLLRRRQRRARTYTLFRGLIAATFVQSRAEARRLRGRAASWLWQRSAASWADLRRPYNEAYAQLRLAESLVAEEADVADVRRALGRAMDLSIRLGARPLRQAVERLAQRSRIDLGDLAALADAPVGSLTPRELQVIRLMAFGQSNREIGTTLGIAEKTAEIHVSNILRKLGVERRVEAAMLAVQRGIVPLDPEMTFHLEPAAGSSDPAE